MKQPMFATQIDPELFLVDEPVTQNLPRVFKSLRGRVHCTLSIDFSRRINTPVFSMFPSVSSPGEYSYKFDTDNKPYL